MSTYNGEKFLQKQLESLIGQDGVVSQILVRDDGSTDSTITILKTYENQNKLKWYQGKNVGPCNSFFDLLSFAPDSEYYAFCDQDDYWLPEKLNSAVRALNSINGYAMYFTQTQMTDADLNPIDTPKLRVRLTVTESIVRSVVTGCTLVINRKMREILLHYKPSYVLMHDSWIYKLCMSLGGTAVFDDNSYILYRQHGNNVLGLQKNRKRELKRQIRESVMKSSCRRSEEVGQIVKNYEPIIPTENLRYLKDIASYRKSFGSKLRLLFSSKFRDKNLLTTIKLKVLLLFNKF